jgi:hypothetical protein
LHSVHAGAIRRDIIQYRLEEEGLFDVSGSHVCHSSNVNVLVCFISCRVLHFISHSFYFVTFVLYMCCVVTCDCSSWKMQDQVPNCGHRLYHWLEGTVVLLQTEDIGTETVHYKVQLLGNVYSADSIHFLICYPSCPVIPMPFTSNRCQTHRFALTTVQYIYYLSKMFMAPPFQDLVIILEESHFATGMHPAGMHLTVQHMGG